MLVRRDSLGTSMVTLITSTRRYNMTACYLASLLLPIMQARDILKKRSDVIVLVFFPGSPSSVIWYAIHFFQFGLEKAAHQLFLEHVLRSQLLQGNL